MAHYVCFGGCGTVKDEPGVCEVTDCELYGKTLSACDCPDGQSHQQVPSSPVEEEE